MGPGPPGAGPGGDSGYILSPPPRGNFGVPGRMAARAQAPVLEGARECADGAPFLLIQVLLYHSSYMVMEGMYRVRQADDSLLFP